MLTVLPPTDNIDKSELTIEVQNNATMPEYENLDLVGNDDNENEEIDSDKDNLADSDEDNVADSDEDNVDESETSYIIEDEFEDEDTDCIANLSEEEVHNIEGKVSEDIQLGCDTEQRIDDGLMESEYEIIELQLKNELLKQENSELESSVGKLSVLHNTLTSSYYDSLKKVAYLESLLKRKEFRAQSLENDDNKTRFYTGLPSYQVFLKIFNILSSITDKPIHSSGKCSFMDEFFLTLVKLRLGLVNQDIAYRMNINEPSVSKVFHTWIDLMYREFKQLIAWPERERLRANLPKCFKGTFSSVVCIIDCFEIFIERPQSLQARAATFSNYKKHNTVKFLIGISPTGSISFISKARGGRVSDKVITQKSGFLDHIEYGDVIMADRGFNISDELAIIGAHLKIPAFTRGQKQLSSSAVEKTRQLANVRIHVERVIGQLKKFKLLQGTLPLTLIKRQSDTTVTTIDKVVTVAASLINISNSII